MSKFDHITIAEGRGVKVTLPDGETVLTISPQESGRVNIYLGEGRRFDIRSAFNGPSGMNIILVPQQNAEGAEENGEDEGSLHAVG